MVLSFQPPTHRPQQQERIHPTVWLDFRRLQLSDLMPVCVSPQIEIGLSGNGFDLIRGYCCEEICRLKFTDQIVHAGRQLELDDELRYRF